MTFITFGGETLPAIKDSIITTEIKEYWSDFNLKHYIGKLGLLKKRGYLHLFKDNTSN